MSAVPIAEVQDHLQMSYTANPELQRFIDAAETAIGHRVGPLTPETVTEVLDGGGSSLLLRVWPVASVTSVDYADGSTVTLTDLSPDLDTGIIYWGYDTAGSFSGGSRFITVTYEAGWAVLPEDLRHAVKELVRHLWETQRGNSSGARPGFADTDDAAPIVGAYSSWPPRVQELVGPYQVPKVA